MVYTWFIDTNVLASWVLVTSDILTEFTGKYGIPTEYNNIYHKKFNSDISYINTLLEIPCEKLQEKHECLIPFLTTNELFSAIRDEIICLKLFAKGEPVSRWPGSKNLFSLDEDEFKIIFRTTMKKVDVLMQGGLEIIEDCSGDYTEFWDVFASLLLKTENTKTQDVMLLTTAIMNEADFFVTRDERLINVLKAPLKEGYSLEIMKPETARLKFNSLNKM
ncbi:MAG: hypothetical protein PHO93_04245 [Candidatus Saccharimonadaceae bacterium]|nr:hypothetical protein [Candidatus Saccharimonadaceae bacterium]